MRRIRLGVQLGLAFAVVAASTALLVAVVMSVTWQGIFESYVRARVQESASTFANMAGASFVTYGRWDSRGLLRLSAAARSYSLRAQVIDAHGSVFRGGDIGPRRDGRVSAVSGRKRLGGFTRSHPPHVGWHRFFQSGDHDFSRQGLD